MVFIKHYPSNDTIDTNSSKSRSTRNVDNSSLKLWNYTLPPNTSRSIVDNSMNKEPPERNDRSASALSTSTKHLKTESQLVPLNYRKYIHVRPRNSGMPVQLYRDINPRSLRVYKGDIKAIANSSMEPSKNMYMNLGELNVGFDKHRYIGDYPFDSSIDSEIHADFAERKPEALKKHYTYGKKSPSRSFTSIELDMIYPRKTTRVDDAARPSSDHTPADVVSNTTNFRGTFMTHLKAAKTKMTRVFVGICNKNNKVREPLLKVPRKGKNNHRG